MTEPSKPGALSAAQALGSKSDQAPDVRQGPWTAAIGLGANLGDARATLQAAVSALVALPATQVQAVSSLWRSAPFEAEGPDFLNAVVLLATHLPPEPLLVELQAIEQKHGRERPYRNAPRTLDLDLLLHGSHEIQSERLTLPHPRMHQRAFVMEPLLELWPHCALPGIGALAHCRAALAGQRISQDAGKWWVPQSEGASTC